MAMADDESARQEVVKKVGELNGKLGLLPQSADNAAARSFCTAIVESVGPVVSAAAHMASDATQRFKGFFSSSREADNVKSNTVASTTQVENTEEAESTNRHSM